LEKWPTYRLDIRINPQVLAVDRDAREVAARSWNACCVEQSVGQVLADLGFVLFVVIKGQAVEPRDGILLDVLVELHLERRALFVKRSDESFLADRDRIDRDAVD